MINLRIKLFSYHFYFPRRKLLYFAIFCFAVYFWGCLPKELFQTPTSTLLYSKDGRLLNAKIADDGQWRFPIMDSTPVRFAAAIIAYEDHTFYHHAGISFKAIGRAIVEDLKAGKIVSGGSTLTMQIARLSRGGNRSIGNKLIEAIWAIRLETRYSKDELMRIYASQAPFGGNVVGLEAASWRYYGLPPYELSWSQVATLAVLPNSPSLVYPGKNSPILLKKRNKVLKTLLKHGKIGDITYELSLDEPLIGAPKHLPSLAPHLMAKAIKNGKKGERIQTTLDYNQQKKLTEVLERHQENLNSNYIHNSALLVIDLHTNEVITYVGNSATHDDFQKYVDLIQAPRSTGSILKPFLYAAMIQEGMVNNHQLIPDVPMHFEHFSPKNYDGKYHGAVRAGEALAQSLNVPAVYLLKQYGIEKFLHKLRSIGQSKISKNAEYYGLSLILGGAESTLWDVANAFSGMAKTLNYYNDENKYNSNTWRDAKLYSSDAPELSDITRTTSKYDAGSIFETFQALTDVNRPLLEASWRQYSSSTRIAWKTGTSYGNRDAWAVGATPDYVVAVWVGNATGEGRPGIIGATAAGPIMFDVFTHLSKRNNWFKTPYDELTKMTICKKSGYRSTSDCTEIDTVLVHHNALRGPSCHFHKTFLTDQSEQFRFYQNCSKGFNLKMASRFVLPPLQAYFYKQYHPEYKSIPPFHANCQTNEYEQTFTLVYPEHNSKLVGTIGLDGKPKPIIFEASSPNPEARLFWHIDNHFLGETIGNHTVKYIPKEGQHLLTVVDELGNQKKVMFTILEK